MGRPAQDALQFASYVGFLTKLDTGALLAWMAGENNIETANNGGNDGNAVPHVPENWLNIAINGTIMRGSPGQLYATPSSGANTSSDFLHGKTVGGWAPGNINVGGILASASQSALAQLQAIQASGWIGGVPGQGGYGNLYTAYQLYKQYAPAPKPPGSDITGGSNTHPTSPWTVGDASNPDQDYWTTINQYCMDGQLYCFSDGEFLIVADGIELMSQRPVTVLNRLDPTVLWPSEASWDNTAFMYASTHVKRGKVQRRAALAKVTSPTEVTVRQICDIDRYRAGDVIYLRNWGPADGPWLIGDCTRSVFLPYSDLTLVQAMSPINAASGVAGITGTQAGSPASVGGYTNPFSKINGLIPERIDMGVDYSGSGTIVAIGSGKILAIGPPQVTGWGPPAGISPGAYITWVLDSGAYKGKMVYFAEGIQASVVPGQHVNTGDPIGTMVGGIECGWAVSVGTPLGASQGSFPTAAGASFSRFLVKLGAQGGTGGANPSGNNPPGYP